MAITNIKFDDEAGRIRTIVKRSNKRKTQKFASLKTRKTHQSESKLEFDAMHVMDVTPHVLGFQEQPCTIYYQLPGEAPTHHTPDLLVRRTGYKELVEIKTDAEARTPEVQKRTKFMQLNLPFFGYEYRLFTESEIRDGHLLRNAKYIRRHGRKQIDEATRAMYQQRLATQGPQTWGELTQGKDAYFTLENTAAIVFEGWVQLDLFPELTDQTIVSLIKNQEAS